MDIKSQLKLLGKVELGDTISINSMTLYKRNNIIGKLKSACTRTLYSEKRSTLREDFKILNQDLEFQNPDLDVNDIDDAIEGLEHLEHGYYSGDNTLINVIDALIGTLKI